MTVPSDAVVPGMEEEGAQGTVQGGGVQVSIGMVMPSMEEGVQGGAQGGSVQAGSDMAMPSTQVTGGIKMPSSTIVPSGAVAPSMEKNV